MIPPINGKLVRTLTFTAPGDEPLLFTLTPDDGGTIEFRTTGRKPTRWATTLPVVFAGLLAAQAPEAQDEPEAAPGGVAKRLLRGCKFGDTVSLTDLEHELSVAHPDDVPRHAEFLRYVYSVMRERARRAGA